MKTKTEPIRLNALISKSGYCSRRTADELIIEGRVSVDGKVVTELGTKVQPDVKIIVEGVDITKTSEKKYIALHKPRLVLTTKKDEQRRKTIYDILPRNFSTLLPVGRLDYDATGLLLMTNDGDLLYRLTHPKYEVPRAYRVFTRNPFTEKDREKLLSGVDIGKGVIVKADEVTIHEDVVYITIHEGKYHHVKRMIEAVDNKVLRLGRASYGNIRLGKLKPGEYRELKKWEVDKLKKMVKLQSS
ncbi:MAG TPA: pseudouridine synthase [Caldisericia bacterium]|nr:pseudouridine synthase [Caldisericia bacterium]HPF49032.1 pseudouridine synthase [Caldisericia bacterium]HPI83104.1 pseudouridine synthase [Caldisericia bacterium]HPQ92331.1 pseudouridine synthase [Caldisericia bacterium]HRV74571.1 pseudouridine synthase [Caldisericia bacterium]